MQIRTERPDDANAISIVTEAAFKEAEHTSGTEARIVEALRAANVLTVSLVAVEDEVVVGHVAYSPVTVSDGASNWYGLGPVSVTPERKGQGIGQALVREGLRRLESAGAAGCVVLGDPDYYQRFGFAYDPTLVLDGIPAGYFQRLVLKGPAARGEVAYHPGFDAI
jgi:predicted N-acetyltransferase YhbS